MSDVADVRSHDENNDESHDKPLVNVSPNGNYLVTYSKRNQTIVGYNIVKENDVTNVDKIEPDVVAKDDTFTVEIKKADTVTVEVKRDDTVTVEDDTVTVEVKKVIVKVKKDIIVKTTDKEIRHICVSNEKILACIHNDDIGNCK